jgi:predicted RNA binding protein YcfA (HicA-like mRNA interferase family)
MQKKITYKVLIKKLQEIHFVQKRMVGTHLIMFNSEYNSTVVLPSVKLSEAVAPYFLRSIKKNLIEKGVLTEEQFLQLVSSS